MNNLITKQTLNPLKVLIGAVFVFLAFYYLTNDLSALGNFKNFIPEIISKGIGRTIVVFLLTIVGLIIAFDVKGFSKLFNDTKKPVSTFFIGYVLSFVVATAAALILTKVLHLVLASNPGHRDVIQTLSKLPLQLFFEEGISLFILIVCANLIFKASKSLKSSFLIANIISAIIFGLLHYWTYQEATVLNTLLHVIAIQGTARLVFNWAAIRSNGITIPYLIHLVYDLTTFTLGSLTK